MLMSSDMQVFWTIGVTQLLCFTAYCFSASVVSGNVSKVDQLWSITPVVYVWTLYHQHLEDHSYRHERLLLVCLLVTIWGARLTYNFWIKGGYGNLVTHEEDYRWPILRRIINNPLLFLLFNVTFIASYQNILLFLISAPPAFEIMSQSHILTAKDYFVAALFLFFFAVETIADAQQFKFQTLKNSLTAEEREKHPDEDIRKGFYTAGLFRFSRHPNYFAEQCMWICVYAFTITSRLSSKSTLHVDALGSTFVLKNFTWLGALLLVLLFQGSMMFSEGITASKYPEYRDYQQTTSMCLPMLPMPSSKKAV